MPSGREGAANKATNKENIREYWNFGTYFPNEVNLTSEKYGPTMAIAEPKSLPLFRHREDG